MTRKALARFEPRRETGRMSDTVALLGTGLLGSGMAERMLSNGVALAVWNRTRQKAEPLAARGARVEASAADAVRGAARVHFVLFDDDAVDAALDAVSPALVDGAVVVDHTTTSPARTMLRAERMAKAGRAFLHAPVFMAPAAARDGKGMMLVAGPRATFDRVAPSLETMCAELWHVGERSDLAAAHKLFGNAMLSAVLGGLSDVMTMSDRLGVPRADALALFDRFNPTAAIKGRGPRMASGALGAASFMVETARKDLGLMLDAAGGGDAVPVLAAFAKKLDALIADGRGADDLAAVGVGTREK
jgi:3-hydroxyisobutyrate dehydrogenase-like beta-hydroxyacid dehydrogenase